jgi:hypothetical protein
LNPAQPYFFFLRFAVFFAAFFAFLFFAICCPPSHDMWRCRNSAAANRRALHSAYTSATEKTLTPLNGTYTPRSKSPDARCDRRNVKRNSHASTLVVTKPRAKIRDE